MLFQDLIQDLGIPLAPEKTAGPVQVITFLGIELDSHRMEIRLPEEKRKSCLELLDKILSRAMEQMKQSQILLGHLTFAVRAGRTFCMRLGWALTGTSLPY